MDADDSRAAGYNILNIRYLVYEYESSMDSKKKAEQYAGQLAFSDKGKLQELLARELA